MKSKAYVNKEGKIVVELASGWVDWPIRYTDGHIAYDAPEKIPFSIKMKVRKLFDQKHWNNREWMYIYDEGKDRYGSPTYSVGNGDGSEKYPITGWKTGRHNMTWYRVDFWFMKNGKWFHGTQYGVKRPCSGWHCVVREKSTSRVKAKRDRSVPYDPYRLRDF